jgi:hypothetical protein
MNKHLKAEQPNQDRPELVVLTDAELDQVSGGRKLVKQPIIGPGTPPTFIDTPGGFFTPGQ